MKQKTWQFYFFPSNDPKISEKWVLLRKLGKDTLSQEAQQKLEWIIFYYTMGKEEKTTTASYFGITRKTLHKWLTRFDEKHLLTLEEQSRAPYKTRGWEVTREEEANILILRKKNMEFGKKKLKVLYKREYGNHISTWRIERVIRKHKLYPNPAKHSKYVEKRARSKPKVRIHEVRDAIKEVKEFGFLWHIDAIIIWWYGQRRIIFTAIEDKTKIAFARVYKSNTSGYAEDFLKRLMYLVEGKVELMHSDNGSEFQGVFEKACEQLNILQIYSRPHTPKDNPALERFNKTIQEEWLDFSESGLDDIQEANNDLSLWLIKYNNYRPHETLEYLTPLEYAQEHFFKVSPMWSASTLSSFLQYYLVYLADPYMNILILNWRDIKNPSSGGAEILTHEIAKRFVLWGHQVTQFSSSFEGGIPEEIIEGVKFIRRGNPDARKIFNSVHFLAFWHYQTSFKGRFDIVVDEFHGLPFFSPWYVKEKKVALICEVAGDLWRKIFGPVFGSIGKITEEISLGQFYRNTPILTISGSTKLDLIKNGIPKKNITVLPVGITFPKANRKPKKETDLTLILVGRLTRQKGIEDGIQALKEVKKRYPKTKLWIVGRGDDSYESYLKSITNKLGLSNSTTFFGFVSEQEKFVLLAKAHILLAPSAKEGWGINIIEANAVGTPSIGYNVSGLRDSIKEGITGFLAKDNSPKELANQVVNLVKDKKYYTEISGNAKIWAKNFFWDKTAKIALDLLYQVYGKNIEK